MIRIIAFVFCATLITFGAYAVSETEQIVKIIKTDDEWKKVMSPEQYYVMRKHGTERAFTSTLNDEHRHGVFVCAACELPLFKSETKFDSGTGWPSFYDYIHGHMETQRDYSLGLTFLRTECHCARCESHLGHVFDDGPKPTGLRYCMNGVALKFIPN